MEVHPERQKRQKHDLCVISMENQFFRCTKDWLYPARYYATPRHNPRSDFYKMVLNRVQGLKKKSQEVSARKK